MANIAKPKSDNLADLSQIAVPVSYSTQTGLALLLSDITVSGKKVVPYIRTIPTQAFISGNYNFPTPNGYVASPYQLPMLEPQSWNVAADVIYAYQPVELYQIGNKSYVNDQGISVSADYMTNTFPINIYPSTYLSDGKEIKPLELNQSIIIRVCKNAGVAINWQSSNIRNNGLTDPVIQSAVELTFVVTNILGQYQVTEWITPDFILTNLSALKTRAKTTFVSIINELYDRTSTDAGGDLTGTYPDPIIGAGKVTNDKLAGSITSDKLKGNIPANKLADGVIPESLPPSGVAGGCLTGTYPNPKLKPLGIIGADIALKTVSSANLALNSVTTDKVSSEAITATKLSRQASWMVSNLNTSSLPTDSYIEELIQYSSSAGRFASNAYTVSSNSAIKMRMLFAEQDYPHIGYLVFINNNASNSSITFTGGSPMGNNIIKKVPAGKAAIMQFMPMSSGFFVFTGWFIYEND